MYPGPTSPPRVFLPNGVSASLKEYKIILERKRAAVQQMCQGLEEFLTIDLDTAIEAIEKPSGQPPQYRPSAEDFEEACARVETAATRLEQLRQSLPNMPEEVRVPWEASVLPFAEQELKAATQQRDYMQKAMEAAEEVTE